MASRHGAYRSTKTGRVERYDSSYELRRFKFLDSLPHVLSWTKAHGIRIRYKNGRKWRSYIPDILVVLDSGSRHLEECKGFHWDPVKTARKTVAALGWCAVRGWRFHLLHEADLERHDYIDREAPK